MGMFDYIEVDYPFPEGYEHFRGQDGQTKSLECAMSYYFITEDGLLFERQYEYRELTEEEKDEYRNKYEPDSIFRNFIPIMTRTGEYTDVAVEDSHLDINAIFAHPDTGYKDSEHFTIRMNNGMVQYIKREEPWIPPAKTENKDISDIDT
jgi:hypothetical protein